MKPRQILVVVLLSGFLLLVVKSVVFQLGTVFGDNCMVVARREFVSPSAKFRIYSQEFNCTESGEEITVSVQDPSDSRSFISPVRVPVKFKNTLGREFNPVSFSVRWITDTEVEIGYPSGLKPLPHDSSPNAAAEPMPENSEEFGLHIRWVPSEP